VSAPIDHAAARLNRVIKPNDRLPTVVHIFPKHGYQPPAALLASDSAGDPQTCEEAIGSLDAADWLAAIQSAYDSLIGRNTWDLVGLPTGRKTIACKWVFKTNRHAGGSIARFKPSLCGKGFSRVHGLNFNETFAPVVKFDTFRVIFSLVANLDLHCK
jgi:hypothetical protein